MSLIFQAILSHAKLRVLKTLWTIVVMLVTLALSGTCLLVLQFKLRDSHRSTGSDEADNHFDAVIGVLEELIMEADFNALQSGFFRTVS